MRNIKNITIVLLMFTAFIQLSNIWNINVQSFFGSNYAISYEEELALGILVPSKVLVKKEDILRMAFNTSSVNTANSQELGLLREIAQNGVYKDIEKEGLTASQLVKDADIIYEYPGIIEHTLVGDTLSIKNTQFEKFNVDFDNVYVNNSLKEVCFYNSITEDISCFTLDNMNLATNYEYNENVGFVYSDSDINFLVPTVINKDYYNLTESNPYSDNSEVLVSTLESKINKYFRYPNEKWTIYGDGNYVFSGEDITVKYYTKNNILEYKNNFETSRKKTDVAAAYAIAKTFIQTDELVVNELVLKKQEKIENSYFFYFNPIINNTEVVFDSELLDYYIMIEVNNGVVREYKKYVMNYDTEFTVLYNIEDFDAFALEEHFDSIELVYLQNMEQLTAELCWARVFGDVTSYIEAD